ncbi:hypothetical protein PO124_21070 [Bacillus licheniformis]|nr:hypothetical protein [Bacillus licheniformis]
MSVDGVIPLAKSFDTVGWMSKILESFMRRAASCLAGRRRQGHVSTGFI